MFWFIFRKTSPWGGGVRKVFLYNSPPESFYHPGTDPASASYTKPQLEALVDAGKRALASWPVT